MGREAWEAVYRIGTAALIGVTVVNYLATSRLYWQAWKSARRRFLLDVGLLTFGLSLFLLADGLLSLAALDAGLPIPSMPLAAVRLVGIVLAAWFGRRVARSNENRNLYGRAFGEERRKKP